MPSEIKKNIQIILVKHLDDVINEALTKLPIAIEWEEKDFIQGRINNETVREEGVVKH